MNMIKCGYDGRRENAVAMANFCWDHPHDKSSYADLLIKAVDRRQDLTGANLTECDLSGANMWSAKLCNVKLWHSSLNTVEHSGNPSYIFRWHNYIYFSS